MTISKNQLLTHGHDQFQRGYQSGLEMGKKELREHIFTQKQKAHVDLAQALAKGIEANSLALQVLSRCMDEGLLK